MTTNRGLEQTLSDERLEDLAKGQYFFARGAYEEAQVMARELLAYRKASKEPMAWTDEVELRGVEKDGCGYLACLSGMMEFAVHNGYIDKSPFTGVDPLRKSRPEPDPLSKDEYRRLLDAAPAEQIRNLWVLAVNTGLRHGEISALAWEDIDTKNWTITVRRNLAIKDHFTPPKTECGNRTINLTLPAIQALKNQMVYTRMGKQHKVKVHLREFGRTRTDECTFVFVPKLTARNGIGGDWYAPGSFGATWNLMLQRAGIRHRKAYESRHTFACWALSAGANPNFIAAQMGHTSAQMVYNVYGKWMSDNNGDQMSIMNANFSEDVPQMPQAISQ